MAIWRLITPKARVTLVGSLTITIAFSHIVFRNLAFADTHKVVSISADGQNRIVTTDATTVGDVLHRAGVKVASSDLVEPSETTKIPEGFFNVNVYRSQLYDVTDGARTFAASSAEQSPRLIAADAGLKLYPEDSAAVEMVSNFVQNPLVGRRLVINRATPATIRVDGSTLLVRSHAATVGDLLKDKGISLGAKDMVSPNLDYGLVPGLVITVTRVADVTVTTKQTLVHSTRTIPDPSQLKGTESVQSPGANGSEDVTYHIHYENGVEMSRQQLAVANVVAPVDAVVDVGTKVVFSGSVEYWRPFVTAAASANGISPNLMMAIMDCESHGNAGASNSSGPGHFGLFQYDPSTWAGLGGTMSNIYDGPTQITKTAYKIANYGTSPWNASKFCWGGTT